MLRNESSRPDLFFQGRGRRFPEKASGCYATNPLAPTKAFIFFDKGFFFLLL
jgi:hypothetical protein